MAATGFMLFGVKDWAPYVMNVFMLFAFLLLVRRRTRVFGIWPSSLAVLGALFVPVSFQSIHQFRPDFPAALAMGALPWMMAINELKNICSDRLEILEELKLKNKVLLKEIILFEECR